MHIKLTFETMELDNQIVAVPVGEQVDVFRGVLKLNETAAFIFSCLEQDTTEANIVDALVKEYDVSKEEATEDVCKCIAEFRKTGLLAE